MALETKIEWNGDKIIKNINSGTIKALIRAGSLVKSSARLNITANHNVDTGNLRASIVNALDKPRLTEKVFTTAEHLKDVTDVSYGYYIEFGTKYFKPSPFMRPALNDNIDKIEKIFISEENKALDK